MSTRPEVLKELSTIAAGGGGGGGWEGEMFCDRKTFDGPTLSSTHWNEKLKSLLISINSIEHLKRPPPSPSENGTVIFPRDLMR